MKLCYIVEAAGDLGHDAAGIDTRQQYWSSAGRRCEERLLAYFGSVSSYQRHALHSRL